MNEGGATCSGTLERAWDLVFRFVRNSDVEASFALYQMLQSPLQANAGGMSPELSQAQRNVVTEALAPTMLNQCLTSPSVETSSPTVILFVCVLNRIFSLKVVPASQAQAMDRRPTGLEELLQFYLSILAQRRDLLLPAQHQLCLCTASLALLVYDDITRFLDNAYQNSAGGQMAWQLYWVLLTSVMDVLSDGRVPLGPIRRATQRRLLQERLHVALLSAAPDHLSEGEQQTMFLQHAEVIDKAVGFLVEGMTGEPQEVAATFWQQLPASATWQWIVCLFRTLESRLAALSDEERERVRESDVEIILPSAVVDCVCCVLRCVTTVDEHGQALLLSLLPATLPLVGVHATCVPACAVISAALEASTEEVVLRHDPSAPVFQLISSAAERLAAVLQSVGDGNPTPPLEATLSACEGISALTQVLLATPVPVREAEDDPEDFAYFTQSITAANEEKAKVVNVLRPFFTSCQRVLLYQLSTAVSLGPSDWRVISEYVRRNIGDNYPSSEEMGATGFEEDFQISFDEVSLAFFTTYERLCKLLHELPVDAIALADNDGKLVGVCSSATAALSALLQGEVTRTPSALLPQAAFLPLLTRRFVRTTTQPNCGNNFWPAETWGSVLTALSTVLESAALERQLEAGAHAMKAAVDVVLASDRLVARRQGGQSSPALVVSLLGNLDRLLNAAWRCLLLPGQKPYHWQLAEDVATVLDLTSPNGATIPPPLLNVIFKQDAHTQLAILSACQFDCIESFMYILRCVQELTGAEDEDVIRVAGERLTRRASAVLPSLSLQQSPSSEQAESALRCFADFSRHLDNWHSLHPQFLLLILQLSESLPASLRLSLRARCLFRFFSTPGAMDTASTWLGTVFCGERASLQHDVCEDVAASSPTQLYQLAKTLLQPHPAFQAPHAEDRLRAVIHAMCALKRAGSVPSAQLLPLLVVAVERCQGVVTAQSMGTEDAAPASLMPNDSAKEDDRCLAEVFAVVLDELAILGQCAVDEPIAEAEASYSSWLLRLHHAADSHEIRSTLKSLIGI